MNAPYYPSLVTDATAPWIILIIGIFFGLFLERSGLGNPHKLTGVFYWTDFTMPKVMFAGVLTASTGLYLLSDLGMLDLNSLLVVPTFFWPQLAGGTLLGLGFVISGYCPGTSMAGFATGRLDALITLIGIELGIVIFALLFPGLEGFYGSSSMGVVTLESLTEINHWVFILVLCAMFVAMYTLTKTYGK